MAEEIQNQETNTPKAKRKYVRHQPVSVPQQPQAPNPNVVAFENDLLPLVRQRQEANQRLMAATVRANQATLDLEAARSELNRIESEVQYRMNIIAQIKNGGVPVPSAQPSYIPQQTMQRFGEYPTPQSSPMYNPVVPYPTAPEPYGVSSIPAPNVGLYPDATDRIESAEDVRIAETKRQSEG